MFENRQVRTSGTKQPEAAPAGAKANTIINVGQIEQFAVRFVDQENNLRITTLIKVGGQYYEPAGAEEWTAKLVQVKPWLQNALTARALSDSTAPTSDSVDVLP